MKIFRWLFAAAIAAAVAALDLYLDKPLHLQYGDWRESFSALRMLMAFVICVAAMQLFLKLAAAVLFFPSRMARWRRARDQKAHNDALAEGVRALAMEDDKRALKLFSRLAERDSKDVFPWLAARAADSLGDAETRDQWLRRAASDSAKDVAAAAKAMLAREENRLNDALGILGAAGAPYGAPLLAGVYLDVARELRRWPQALAAAYRLQAHANPRRRRTIADEIARAGLADMEEPAELRHFWKTNISADDRKKPTMQAEYIRALRRLGDDAGAAEALERAAKTSGGAPAVISAAADLGGQELRETVFARGEKNPENKNPEYLAAMGALAGSLGFSGKARRYYQAANALRPEPRFAKALAEVEEKMRAETEKDFPSAPPSSPPRPLFLKFGFPPTHGFPNAFCPEPKNHARRR